MSTTSNIKEFSSTPEIKPTSSSWLQSIVNNPLFYSISQYKKSLNLPNPGQYEHLHREVKNVFVTNHLVDGARFDITKGLSPNFQAVHSFSLGSAQVPSSYNFISLYADEKIFLQGSIDNEGSLSARIHSSETQDLKAKVHAQISNQPGHSMLQLEGDYSASDCTLNAKVLNPGIADNTGIGLCSILQSVTPNLALGAEAVFQRPTTEIEESSISYTAKYATPNSVLTANYQQPGLIQASYFHKVNDMAEFGVELQTLVAQGKRDAACTLGAKFDFVKSTFRTQIDTTGRVSAVLEERLAPSLTLTLSGDLDHLKGQSKFGIGLQINS